MIKLTDILVSITLEATKIDFKGEPNAVLASINEFFLKQIPNINLAKKISVNYSLEQLTSIFSKYVKLTPEGPRIWIENKKLSDREKICLQLIAFHIAYLAQNSNNSKISMNIISNLTGLNCLIIDRPSPFRLITFFFIRTSEESSQAVLVEGYLYIRLLLVVLI